MVIQENGQNMSKPIILAICGKSASGKDTLAKQLCSSLGENTHMIVSDTTRPPRAGEQDGINYNFISTNDFLTKQYLEWTRFKGWYYGTPISSLSENINIGVFNFQGVKQLSDFKKYYTIIPILLKANVIKRLYRSIKREHKFQLEYIRRIFADMIDYRKNKRYFKEFNIMFTMPN